MSKELEFDKLRLKAVRKKISELNLDYSHMTDAGYDGILFHFNGEIVEGNEAFANTIGCTQEETVGLNAFQLYPPESIAVVMQKLQEASEEPYEVAAHTLKGKPFLVSIWGMNFELNGEMGRVIATKKIRDL